MDCIKKRVLAIINPISGIRPKHNIPSLINNTLDKTRFEVDIVFTEYAGHATELAQKAVEMGTDYVLAIGGDGTINETAKALIHTDTALGIIPLGSGNGLARHLHIPLDSQRALRVINEENITTIDYCLANEHIFFCTAGIGFDAWISKKFSEDKHRGGLVYIKNVLAEYLKYKPKSYKLILNNGTTVEQKAFLIACANASQYGNNAYIAPGANMQDSLMDITILKPFNYLEAPQLAVQLFTKQLPNNSKILSLRDSTLIIEFEGKEVMHIDGEPIWMDSHIEVKTIPAGLKILTPTHISTSLIEPIQNAIEELQYNILYDIKEVFRKIENDYRK